VQLHGRTSAAQTAHRKANMAKRRGPEALSVVRPEPPEVAFADFPIVGIGTAAGGFIAVRDFFAGVPAKPAMGVAFVLVQHRDADHPALDSEDIRRLTHMPVFDAGDVAVVKANGVYVAPSGCDLTLCDGVLQPQEVQEPSGIHQPIDQFFQSLALDMGARAVGVVLSGAGNDGALGLQAIRAHGGFVMVQLPDSAEFGDMPRSALATGAVDVQLAPFEMADRLLGHWASSLDRQASTSIADPLPEFERGLRKILAILRDRTGHDLSAYKRDRLVRCVQRRMAACGGRSIREYVEHLRLTPGEPEALFCDSLVGVTSFFRDPEHFQELAESVLSRLVARSRQDRIIRVWSAGCSTGEEAYSLAILLHEQLETSRYSRTVMLFASDIDGRAVRIARAGIYPASIAADVSPERLCRYFTVASGGDAYKIHRSIRDMVVFCEHDVTKDPSFNKMDLIVCRNLLIYLGLDQQQKVLGTFRSALKPDGALFLGSAEGLGELTGHFRTIDAKSRLFGCPTAAAVAPLAADLAFVPLRAAAHATPQARGAVPAVEAVRTQLHTTEPRVTGDDDLDSTIGKLQRVCDDLRCVNQELLSINEELRSTNDELSASGRASQLSAETIELANVRARNSLVDLARVNDDMANLLSGTGIASLFLDTQLRIRRVTPGVEELICVVQTDLGRPLAHFANYLRDCEGLVDELRDVLESLVPLEREVSSQSGKSYLMRIHPSQRKSGQVDGVALSFVEVTESVNTRRTLALAVAAQEEAACIARVGGWEFDASTGRMSCSAEALRSFGTDPVGPLDLDGLLVLIAPEFRQSVAVAAQASLETGARWDIEVPLVAAKDRAKWVRLICHPRVESGRTVSLHCAVQDITERRGAE
jgi:two-component system CheB/CheR fusion protein